jgi:hypothetical protein
MRLVLIFNETRPDTTGIYFRRACDALRMPFEHWQAADLARIPAGADLYLRIDHGDDYEVRWPRTLRPAVFYAIDTHLPHSWKKIRRIAAAYDLVCCSQQDAAATLPGAEWVPLGCDLEWHSPPPPSQFPASSFQLPASTSKVWDIAFVGSEGGIPRTVLLQALRERYPNSFIGAADHTRLGAIYGRARVGFNYSIANEVNMRVFEVPASGCLLVTNPLPAESLRRLGLEDRRHLVVYRSPAELFPLMDHYLSHDEEREAIARAGADVVRRDHTYAHRLKQLLEMASTRLGLSLQNGAQGSGFWAQQQVEGGAPRAEPVAPPSSPVGRNPERVPRLAPPTRGSLGTSPELVEGRAHGQRPWRESKGRGPKVEAAVPSTFHLPPSTSVVQ